MIVGKYEGVEITVDKTYDNVNLHSGTIAVWKSLLAYFNTPGSRYNSVEQMITDGACVSVYFSIYYP